MAKKEEKQEQADPRKAGLKAGAYVLLMLGVLTLGEYLVGTIAPSWTALLWIVAIWKSIYVVKDYMHIGRLFSAEEGHE